jgi:hypothetical protein
MADASTAPCAAIRKTIVMMDQTKMLAQKSAITTWFQVATRSKAPTIRESTGHLLTANGLLKDL